MHGPSIDTVTLTETPDEIDDRTADARARRGESGQCRVLLRSR